MKRVACVIIFWLTASLLIGGCSRDVKEDAGDEVLVNLDISVALSDVAQSMTRSVEEDAMAKGDHEKMQKLRVIVVREEALKKKICQQAKTQPMVEQADVLLVFCATDQTDFMMPCGQYGYVVDMALATGFALVEAADQGLDTCIVCAFEEAAVKAVLAIPESARVVSMVVMGYGADDSPRREKKTLEQIVSYEHF